jgi:RNA polymerase sigma-70 factor (ECF subfamily)
MSESESTLLERARAGDHGAFGALVRLHHGRIYRLALQLTGGRGEADDVAQETFVRAWRAIDRFDGRAELFTWLYRICVNVALNHRRSRRRETVELGDPRIPEPQADGEGSDPHASAAQAQAHRALYAAIETLSESLRTTLVLACVEQIPYADIAKSLGCSEGTVAWRVHEARRKLRDALGDSWFAAMEARPDAGRSEGGGSRG